MRKFLIIFVLMTSQILFADSIIKSEVLKPSMQDLQDSIKLKPNQVLLIDYKNQKLIGIIEMKPDGSFIRLPLPKNNLPTEFKKPLESKKPQDLEEKPKNPKKEDNNLIYKDKQWDKKQIPYLIKEEILLPRD